MSLQLLHRKEITVETVHQPLPMRLITVVAEEEAQVQLEAMELVQQAEALVAQELHRQLQVHQ
jgi:hypothetical protein